MQGIGLNKERHSAAADGKIPFPFSTLILLVHGAYCSGFCYCKYPYFTLFSAGGLYIHASWFPVLPLQAASAGLQSTLTCASAQVGGRERNVGHKGKFEFVNTMQNLRAWQDCNHEPSRSHMDLITALACDYTTTYTAPHTVQLNDPTYFFAMYI